MLKTAIKPKSKNKQSKIMMVLNISSFLYDHSVLFFFLIDRQDCLVLLVVTVLVVVGVIVAAVVVDDPIVEITKKG
jgi:hypothetical protein